jgi:hypothetical protein
LPALALTRQRHIAVPFKCKQRAQTRQKEIRAASRGVLGTCIQRFSLGRKSDLQRTAAERVTTRTQSATDIGMKDERWERANTGVEDVAMGLKECLPLKKKRYFKP